MFIEFQSQSEYFAIVGIKIGSEGEFGENLVVKFDDIVVVKDTWKKGADKAAVTLQEW